MIVRYLLCCILMFLIVLSCVNDPKVEAISNYVQTIENTKTDFGFKKLEFDKIGEFRGTDSARIVHESRWTDEFNPDSNLFEYFEISNKEMYEDAKAWLDELDSMIENEDNLDIKIRLLDSKQSAINDKYDSQKQWIRYSELNNQYKEYQDIGDSVLYELYRCKYKIRNPFLDAVQEVVDTFYFYPGTDKVAFN